MVGIDRSSARATPARRRVAAATFALLGFAAGAATVQWAPPHAAPGLAPGLGVATPRAQRMPSVAAPSQVAQAAAADAALRVAPARAAAAERAFFEAFALNLLLVPLLDDNQPPRWADPAVVTQCAQLQLRVDGQPLQPLARVPTQPFTLRWDMDRCIPLGTRIELSGSVELAVTRGSAGYTARVAPLHLELSSDAGTTVFDAAFTARTPLACDVCRPAHDARVARNHRGRNS